MNIVPSLQELCKNHVNSQDINVLWCQYPLKAILSSKNDLHVIGEIHDMPKTSIHRAHKDTATYYDDYGVFQLRELNEGFVKTIHTDESDSICLEFCVPFKHLSGLDIVCELKMLGFEVNDSKITSFTLSGFIVTDDVWFMSCSHKTIPLGMIASLPLMVRNMQLDYLSKRYQSENIIWKFLRFHCQCNEY